MIGKWHAIDGHLTHMLVLGHTATGRGITAGRHGTRWPKRVIFHTRRTIVMVGRQWMFVASI